MKQRDRKKLDISTICVKENLDIKSGESHILPIHASSAFSYQNIEDSIDVFEGRKQGYVYGRYGNPTVTAVQNKLALMESKNLDHDAFCIMTSSGLAAISTLTMSMLKPGDAILTHDALYGGSTELLKKLLQKNGVEVIVTKMDDPKGVRDKLETHKNIRLFYFETPTNPTLQCFDIKELCDLATAFNITTAIDNTFCTSYLQRPMDLGVDFVVYSTTKFINGHGNSIAGAIIGRDRDKEKAIWDTMKLLGTNCSPWEAWLTHIGLKTLAVRLDRACSNAQQIAEFLETHPKVNRVNYPGLRNNPNYNVASKQMSQFGAILSFEIKGELQNGIDFMNKTQICTIAATLGNADTLLLHPATSSHLNIDREIRMANGITDGLIRISVGIEKIDDLIDDISQALA